MSSLAVVLLVAGALLIGVILQVVGDVRVGWEWAGTSVAAFIGGWLGSEAFGTLSTWGPEFEGLFIVPAAIGALILGIAMDAVLRYVTRGSYVHSTRPA